MLEEKDMLINRCQEVADLNRVARFDPVRLLQKSIRKDQTEDEQAQLLLKYKKLWFRCSHRNGRIRLTALRLTEEIAIVQAEVYLDKDDEVPVANYIASRTVHNTPGGLYIQAAEYEATDNALTDAGFGIQLCDVCKTWGEEAYTKAREKAQPPAGFCMGENPTAQDLAGPQAAQLEKDRSISESETMAVADAQQSTQRSDPETMAEDACGETSNSCSDHGSGISSGLADNSENPEARADGERQPQLPENQEYKETAKRDPADVNIGTGTAPMESDGCEDLAEDVNLSNTAAPIVQDAPSEAAPAEPQSGEDESHAQALSSRAEQPNIAQEDPIPVGGDEELTLAEALNVIADVGSCRGKTLAQIADRRPTTLRWYFTTCPDSSEHLKKAARIVFESLNLQKSA